MQVPLNHGDSAPRGKLAMTRDICGHPDWQGDGYATGIQCLGAKDCVNYSIMHNRTVPQQRII